MSHHVENTLILKQTTFCYGHSQNVKRVICDYNFRRRELDIEASL